MTDFLHDAELRTESWQRRHSPEAIAQLGVWRWKGIQKHAGRILDLICGKLVIDFGGFDGPLGFGSLVVDAKAERKTLDDVPGPVDVIFTSHTLEHLDDAATWLQQAFARLTVGGYLIVHVPAMTCRRWNHDQYMNPAQAEGHKATFCLSEYITLDSCSLGTVGGYTRIDAAVYRAGFNFELAEYVGDDSILVIARKP